jgi:non-ribosomal peptide synthetase component F
VSSSGAALGGGLAVRLAGLSAEQRALFEQLIQTRRQAATQPRAASIPRVSGAAAEGQAPVRLPLSFGQERLWFLDRLAPSSAYHIPVALAAHGRLSLPAMAAAVGRMVRRHAVLRTCFVALPGGGGLAGREEGRSAAVVQVIAPPGDWRLPVVDLAALPPAARAAEAHRLGDGELARPFDLEHGPVLRNLALRLGPAEHVLLLIVHHIAADGWSSGVILHEIVTLYAAALAGAPPAGLPELRIQYADFAVWQRGWLRGERLEGLLAHWREGLAGAPRLELPADRPRPAALSFRGAVRRHAVAAATAARVRDLARRHDATLFMVLLAAVQTLLGRHAAQRDVVIGSPIANRTRAEVEPLIGFFVNSLVLRGDLSGDPSFSELIGRSRRAALLAYAHQDLPFERLVEELRPARQLAHNPLFSVMFGVQNVPQRAVELPGVRFSPFELHLPVARFDLEMMVNEEQPAAAGTVAAAAGLSIEATWNAEMFEPATMLRLLGHLDTLLAAVTADPGRRLSALPLLAAAERQQLMAEWNDTAAALPELALPELFAGMARRRPDAIALVDEEGCVSYGELWRQAAEMARQLRAAGVGGLGGAGIPGAGGVAGSLSVGGGSGIPGAGGGAGAEGIVGERQEAGGASETRVGLLAARSPATIAGLLGILLAGGVYVPLDPAHPPARLALMLAESGVQVVLGQPELYERLAAATQPDMPPRWLSLPAGCPAPALPAAPAAGAPGEVSAEMGGAVHPGALAYVMYTSGSTGRPKGVGITHRGIVRLVRHGGFADLGPEQVFLQLAPLSFDASTLEIWAPLLGGGRLALPPPRPVSLQEIGAAVARWGVTTLWLTAGLFHQMVEESLPALAPLGQLLAGGDVLSPPHVARALAGLPRTALVNGYGPTEATTFTCCAVLAPGAAPVAGAAAAEVPRPAAGTGSANPAAASEGARPSAASDGAHPAAGSGNAGPAAPAAAERVPIGRPIGNTRVHVLGLDGELAPAGVWGELWVGGDGLARGYLEQPDLTAQSFAPDPLAGVAAEPGARLYRTGDRARRLADGRLEFGGRRDGQVKLRGIRIELGEVEAMLASHPAVAAAAATVLGRRGDGLSPAGGGAPSEQLVAYVVPRLEGAGSEAIAATLPSAAWTDDPVRAGEWRELAAELRRFLAAALPAAMVPAALVPLAALPLSANGKVDRRALPAPESVGMPAAAHQPPATPIEEAVAAATAEVLGIERAGMSDDFFALGGQSLLATQLVSRLVQAHNLPVNLQMIFDARDLRDLSDRIQEAATACGAPLAPPISAPMEDSASLEDQAAGDALGAEPHAGPSAGDG